MWGSPAVTLSILFAATALAACQPSADFQSVSRGSATPVPAPGKAGSEGVALDLTAASTMEQLVDVLASRQLVFIGEIHDRYDHHLNQLAIIRGLHSHHPDLVIGLEFFQQPFQPHLDRFIDGTIDERTFLRETEYFERWRFDYRLYRPILDFAAGKRIPVLALNVPREITETVSREGLDGLSPEQRAQIPQEMDASDPDYRQRVRMAFDAHPPDPEGKREFEHFLSVQLLWDEGMAERVAQYFKDNPGGHMVVLAGAGHVVYGQGIPGRVQRRVPVSSAIVVNGTEPGMSADLADYVVLTQPHELPAAGKLGVLLDTGEDGVRVQGFADESPAKAVGLEEGDRIIALDGESVKTYTDVRLIMFDRTPGEQVRVRVARGEGETDTVDYLVTLH